MSNIVVPSKTADIMKLTHTNQIHNTFFLSHPSNELQGLVAFNDNGTRLPTRPQILKYRDSSVINNCGEAGTYQTFQHCQERIMSALYLITIDTG